MEEYSGGDIEKNESGGDKEIISAPQQIENQISSGTTERKPINIILFVDDEEPIRKLFKAALEKSGYEVVVASDGKEGMKIFKEHPADLIITDIFMPEIDGHAFIHEIIQAFPEAKIFAITGKQTLLGIENELDIAKTLGASRVFTKPVKLRDIINAIQELSLQPQAVTA